MGHYPIILSYRWGELPVIGSTFCLKTWSCKKPAESLCNLGSGEMNDGLLKDKVSLSEFFQWQLHKYSLALVCVTLTLFPEHCRD